MNGQGLDPLFVANGQARFRGDPADATEPQAGELFLPCIEQRHGVTTRDGEQQLEILTVTQRRQEGVRGGPDGR